MMKLSSMKVGDYGLLNGDVVKLKDGGKAGGADNDLYLAFVCDARNAEEEEGIHIETLTDIDIDTDDISI